MADVLSSYASAVTLLGCATESIKFLLIFFRQFNEAPAEIRQWLEKLESLHSTLNSLRELDERYRFSTDFTQKLVKCLTYLQTCVTEINKIHMRLVEEGSSSKNSWDHTGRRFWEKIKWTAVGGHRRKKTVEVINIYHFEFSMELFKMMMYIP